MVERVAAMAAEYQADKGCYLFLFMQSDLRFVMRFQDHILTALVNDRLRPAPLSAGEGRFAAAVGHDKWDEDLKVPKYSELL